MPAFDAGLVLRGITKPFEDALQELDRKNDWNLSVVWKQCMKFHDDNALLRANMRQLESVLQVQYKNWAEIQSAVTELTRSLVATDPEYVAKMKAAISLADQATKMVATVSLTIRDLKKEIRMTEFQSKFFFHINVVQQFMLGLTAIHFKHLQSNEKLEAIQKDLRVLAKVFSLQEVQEERE